MAFEKQGIKPGREGNQPTVNRSTSVFENEKKFRKGKKFEKKETKGEKIRKKLKEATNLSEGKKPKNIMDTEKSLENLKKDYRFPKKDIQKRRQKAPNPPRRVPGEQKEMIPLAKGGRAGFKSGSKGCKLAMKGKGRAYGKNS